MNKIKFTFIAAAWFSVLSVLPPPCTAQGKNVWARFEFLLGEWSGTGGGRPGEAMAGSTSFSADLDGKIMVRKSRAEFASGTAHQDLMIVYPLAGDSSFQAVYFDNEGHVIHYAVSFPAVGPAAAFESKTAANEPRFRLVYERGAEDELTVEFLIAPPGGSFKSYTKGALKKKT
jgi:hypothetical protein